MVWLVFLVLIPVLAIAGYPRMKIPREPQREGPQAVSGYDRVSRGLILSTGRYLTLRFLKRLHPQGTLIDVGAGPGYLANSISHKFPYLRVISLDINEAMLRQAAKNFPHLRFELCRGDAQALPFSDGTVDFIVSTAAFHHWEDPAQVLNEFHRVLKPGGQFLILDMRRDARRFYYWLIKLMQRFMPQDIKRSNGAVGSFWASYTVAEMDKLLLKSTFSVWKTRPQSGWMFVWGQKEQTAPWLPTSCSDRLT